MHTAYDQPNRFESGRLLSYYLVLIGFNVLNNFIFCKCDALSSLQLIDFFFIGMIKCLLIGLRCPHISIKFTV